MRSHGKLPPKPESEAKDGKGKAEVGGDKRKAGGNVGQASKKASGGAGFEGKKGDFLNREK